MTGFFTFLSLGIAFVAGGWYWVGFVIMLLVWGNKMAEDEKKKAKNGSPEPQMPSDNIESPSKPRNRHAVDDWRDKLTEVCSRYPSPDFYVAEMIPQVKLQNALRAYPLNDGGQPIALIDATVFGSANNGMLIGQYGLSWHNMSADSKISTMSWEKLSNLAISVDGSKIRMGRYDAVFETNTTQFKQLHSLLESIVELWKESVIAENSQLDEPEVRGTIPPLPIPAKPPKPAEIDVNTADFDSLLALPGIGAAEAKMVIQHRETIGQLTSIEALEALLSLKPHIVERVRPLVTFSSTKPEPPETTKPIPSELPRPKPPVPPVEEPRSMPPVMQGPVRAPIDF